MKTESYVKYKDKNRGIRSLKIVVGEVAFYYSNDLLVGINKDITDITSNTYVRSWFYTGRLSNKHRQALRDEPNVVELSYNKFDQFVESGFDKEVLDKGT